MFPRARPRRLRSSEAVRGLVRETTLSPSDLVCPLFIVPGTGVEEPVASMPGVHRFSVDKAVEHGHELASVGLRSVILFGVPSLKDSEGSEAWSPNGVVQQAARALTGELPGLHVITDVCLCEYTDHGHCGVVEDGKVLNDPTLELLARQALSHAHAGAHMIAPSDMMDGRVGFLREALDEEGFSDVSIMSYAVKFAGAFYGPFREAAQSSPSFGDRRSYQMDPANAREARREALSDVEQGADIVMVKPAMPCLDVVGLVREAMDVPVAAYQVSGEYAMIVAAAERGWLDRDAAVLESLTAIRRAGADMVVTYFAPLAARLLER